MTNLKFKVGDVLKHKDFRGLSTKVTVLEVNHNDIINAYRTSDEPNYWWHKDTVEMCYELSEEKQPPKFKTGDIVGRSDNDHFRRLIREIDKEGNYWVSRYNADMLYPEDDTFKLSATYINRRYQLIKKPTEFEVLLENARRDRKRANKTQLEYLKYQEKYERAMEAYDKAQLAITKYVQSKINDGLED